ncbi:MAG: molecular chaperone TorD family protein [bacterium]
MVTQTRKTRAERAAGRGLARSAIYRLLSQALVYPSGEAIAALREVDLPQAELAAAHLPPKVVPLLAALAEQLQATDAVQLQTEHRRVFSHIMSLDCPPCETFYTARHIFQETQELSDIGGFFRAFGLEMGDKERLDHISVELEFMHFLTYKEAYALTHHGSSRARLCREVQRKFMRDHLGRWALRFADRLAQKAGGGYFGCVASLTEAFLAAEVSFLRARPESASAGQEWRNAAPEEFTCPMAEVHE